MTARARGAFDLGRQEVVRDRDGDRPRATGSEEVEGAVKRRRDRGGLGQRLCPARHGPEALDLVRHFVERTDLAADQVRRDVRHHHEDRYRSGIRLDERREGVRRAGARGHDDDGGGARGARVAVGHERRARLVAGEHVRDPRLPQQRVVDREVVDAGDAEDVADAFGGERLHHPFAAGVDHSIALKPRSITTSTSVGPACARHAASTSRSSPGFSTRSARTPRARARLT